MHAICQLLILLSCNATVPITHKLFSLARITTGEGLSETKEKSSLEKNPLNFSRKFLTANTVSIFACLAGEGKLFAVPSYLLLSL